MCALTRHNQDDFILLTRPPHSTTEITMHYIIIGNGVAGIEAAMTLRQRYSAEKAKITVISKETDFFFSRTALMYAYMNKMERKDLEPFERGAYDQQHITLVRDEVIDLNADTHTITLKEGGELLYTKLLIATGAKPRHIPFDGIDEVKDGLVNFVSMQDLDACERLTPTTTHAVVVGGGLIGIELVECLLHHGVKVTFLVRESSYWPVALTPLEAERVATHMRAHGVDLRLEEELQTIHTDPSGRVNAITTKGGERLDIQLLGLCIGVAANVEWLKGATTPPKIDRSLCVDRAFTTSLPDVYGAGDCIQMDVGEERPLVETIWYSAKRHGRLAALAMLGDHVQYAAPLFFNSSKFFEIEYTTVGDVIQVPEHASRLWRTHPTDPHLSQLITFDPTQQDRVLGFNLLGSRWNHRILEQWILERRDIHHVKTHLHTAQFDVEFGRANLDAMTEQQA